VGPTLFSKYLLPRLSSCAREKGKDDDDDDDDDVR
jgi:hypothetical protein